MLQIEIELEQTTILINLCDFISIKSQKSICTIKDSYLYDTCISNYPHNLILKYLPSLYDEGVVEAVLLFHLQKALQTCYVDDHA